MGRVRTLRNDCPDARSTFRDGVLTNRREVEGLLDCALPPDRGALLELRDALLR